MMRRLIVAIGTAVLGAAAYRLFQELLAPGFLPSSGYIGLAVGAIGSTLAFYDSRPRGWLSYLRPAMLIVEVTIACVGVSVGASSALAKHPLDLSDVFGAVGFMLFFGLIFASWWLVPAHATILWATNRLASNTESTGRDGPSP